MKNSHRIEEKKLKIGYAQFKPYFCDSEKNVKKIESLLKKKSWDLIVLPELSNSGYYFSSHEQLSNSSERAGDGIFTRMLLDISAKVGGYIIAGFCEKAKDNFYNSSFLAKPDGTWEVYRKTHLYNEEKLWFAPGDTGFKVHSIRFRNGVRVQIGMLICFDWIFPEAARTLALKGAQIICHPSNLVMPYCQRAMYARAVENRVFTITANRIGSEKNKNGKLKFTGQSLIYNPDGKKLAEAPLTKEEVRFVKIKISEAHKKHLNKFNHVFEDRVVEKYYS